MTISHRWQALGEPLSTISTRRQTRLRQSQLEQEPLEKQNFDHERFSFDPRQSVRVTSNYAEQLRSEAKLFWRYAEKRAIRARAAACSAQRSKSQWLVPVLSMELWDLV